ncbi:hypothetical protein AC477_01860 [miscellaneous Crenarchaeota group-1 archaeon SG8-32-1]|uniref:YkgJ family cysteine cluster protein n=1 Tax=miscellaneous Crenarchaeota group-1 archaeon SG8-32-1 TaxID=1685124 RepID=A0A0M0BX32_9ARCH|nr:MAG: hypothetical protein AC477_01860 [miscellaneous Crenarchaeota group-1 archaeon SG8-32-1]
MNYTLATITLSKNKNISKLLVTQKQFRFKCKRCADLCCKLGGPELLEEDVKRIEASGYLRKHFLLSEKMHTSGLTHAVGALKTKNNGSCIFLSENHQMENICSIYEFRPVLCRIYPFKIERLNQNTTVLKFIPCCKGLNNPEGKILDEKFFSRLLNKFIKLVDSNNQVAQRPKK